MHVRRLGRLIFGSAALLSVALVATPTTSAGAATATGSPIPIGQIESATTATSNTSLYSASQTLKAWASWTNAHGGINGHKIVVYSLNDNTDPAKASVDAKQLIDQDHVVAMVGENATATESVWRPLFDAASIPIIGGGCYDPEWTTDPNMFCVTTTAILDGLKAQDKAIVEAGGKTVGITYSSTSPQAGAAAPLFQGLSKQFGLNWAGAYGVTGNEPDYTSQCVAFKQAGATDVGIEGAPNLINLAKSCARQNYYPRYTSGDGGIGTNGYTTDPNIHEMIAAVYSFPYTVSSTPATKEFHNALNKYAPQVLSSSGKQSSTQTWTAAIAFQTAAQMVKANTPTAYDITSALNSFQNQTLGGLASAPLTFTAGQAHQHNSCWWYMVLKNGKLTAPDGMKQFCTP
jgi:branched-chain amino acid transport system substrate-binding protein